MDNIVVPELTRDRVRKAAAKDVWKSLQTMRTAATTLIPVAKPPGGVKRDTVQAGPVQKPPISKSREGARPHHMVRGGPAESHRVDLSLVRLPEKSSDVVITKGRAEEVTDVSPSSRVNPRHIRLRVRGRY